jgi:hypothetical protein
MGKEDQRRHINPLRVAADVNLAPLDKMDDLPAMSQHGGFSIHVSPLK